MILQRDRGSHQSTIYLAASHHSTGRTGSVFLTAAHSEKVVVGRRQGESSDFNMFLLVDPPVFIFVYSLRHLSLVF